MDLHLIGTTLLIANLAKLFAVVLDNVIAAAVRIGEKARGETVLHDGGKVGQNERCQLLDGTLRIPADILLGLYIGVREEQICLHGTGRECRHVRGWPTVEDGQREKDAALLGENIVEKTIAFVVPLEESSNRLLENRRGVRRKIVQIQLRKMRKKKHCQSPNQSTWPP